MRELTPEDLEYLERFPPEYQDRVRFGAPGAPPTIATEEPAAYEGTPYEGVTFTIDRALSDDERRRIFGLPPKRSRWRYRSGKSRRDAQPWDPPEPV